MVVVTVGGPKVMAPAAGGATLPVSRSGVSALGRGGLLFVLGLFLIGSGELSGLGGLGLFGLGCGGLFLRREGRHLLGRGLDG